MTEVWITLDTSDYYATTITGVWSSEEKAKQYINDGGYSDIECFRLNTPHNDDKLRERTRYYCRMNTNGVVEKEAVTEHCWVYVDRIGRATRYSAKGKVGFWSESYKSAKHARKLCEDKRQEWLTRKAILGERA